MSTFIANLAVVLDRIGSLIRSSRGDILQTDDTTTRILEAEMSSNVETSNIGSLQRQADQLAVSRKHFVNMRKQQSMVLFTMHTHDMKRAAHVVIQSTKAKGGKGLSLGVRVTATMKHRCKWLLSMTLFSVWCLMVLRSLKQLWKNLKRS